jgi:hypothetical protein
VDSGSAIWAIAIASFVSHSRIIVCTGRAAVLHNCADWVRVGLYQAHSHQQGEEDIHDCPSPTGLYAYIYFYSVVAYCLGSSVSDPDTSVG